MELISQALAGIYSPTPIFAALMVPQEARKAIEPAALEGLFEGAGIVAEEVRTVLHRVPKMQVIAEETEEVKKLTLRLEIEGIGNVELNQVPFVVESVEAAYSRIVVLDAEELARNLPLFVARDETV